MESNISSFAAVSAIKAMRKQLKALEAENFELKKERKRLIEFKKLRDEKFDDRKEKLKNRTEYAKQMLKAASIATAQISDVRLELEKLIQKSKKTEELLSKEKKKNQLKEEKLESMKSDFASNSQRLSAYESFLGEFLSPPPQPTAISLNEFVVLSSDDSNISELDSSVSDLYSRLEAQPKKFKVQDLETKKSILKDLCEGHEVSNRICERIQFLERQRFSVSNKEMNENTINLYKEFFAITNEMKNFDFN